jgi:hypothetical protein
MGFDTKGATMFIFRLRKSMSFHKLHNGVKSNSGKLNAED